MKIIYTDDITAGQTVDFTSSEALFFNKKKAENKVEKMVCPICGRLARPSNDYATYDHALTFKGERQWDMTDVCRYPDEVRLDRELNALRVASYMEVSMERVVELNGPLLEESLYVGKMRKYKVCL